MAFQKEYFYMRTSVPIKISAVHVHAVTHFLIIFWKTFYYFIGTDEIELPVRKVWAFGQSFS